MQLTVAMMAQHLGGRLLGSAELPIERIAPLETADERSITFISSERYKPQLATTRAACVILAESMADWPCAAPARILVADPYLQFARLTQWWKQQHQVTGKAGVHPTAVVDPSAVLAPSAHIGPLVHVAAGAVIAERAVIGPRCTVGEGAAIGEDTRLVSGVSIGAGCRIGRRGLLHPGVVIGADGFGFAPVQGRWEKIEQLGAVRVGDDVEIGANTCIDRGALDDTVIEDGVKIDNLVQIGHNVHIGAHTAIAGCVGVAGSARIGAHCMIGGAAMILGHLEIAEGTQVTSGTLVSRSIRLKGVYSGAFPFDDNASWEKNAATLRQLHQMRERLRALEKKLS